MRIKINLREITLAFLVFFSINASAQNLFISGGHDYSLVICSDGGVLAWGNNSHGQLGPNGPAIGSFSSSPVTIPPTAFGGGGGKQIKQVDAGSTSHAIALACDGTVYGWGWNKCGQLGDGVSTAPCDNSRNVINPIQVVGGATGTAFLQNVTFVTSGADHSLAILSTGELVSWGNNSNGELGNGGVGTVVSSPVYVLKPDGTRLTGVIAVDAGDATSYALTSDGKVYTWGQTANDALGRPTVNSNYAMPVKKQDGTDLTGIIQISGGDTHGLALDANGNVWSWGGDWGPGQLGQTAGYDTQPYAALVAGGATGTTYLENVIAISAGQAHSMAALSDGKMVTWGADRIYNPGATDAGQLGNGPGDFNPTELPIYVLTGAGTQLTDVKSVSDGDGWSFAVTNSNVIYVMGYNAQGQLGLGHTSVVAYATQLTIPGCGVYEACPVADLGADYQVCPTGINEVLNAGSTGTYYQYQWLYSATEAGPYNPAPGATNNVTYTATQLGFYKVVITDTRPVNICGGCPAVTDTIELSEIPPPFTPIDASYCGTNATFAVKAPATGGPYSYEWYDAQTGGTLRGTTTGTVADDTAFFTVPIAQAHMINATTYRMYVKDITSLVAFAKPTLPGGCGGPATEGGDRTYHKFTVTNSFTIESVQTYMANYGGAGNEDIYVEIFNDNSNAPGTLAMPASTPVSFPKPAAGSFSLVTLPVNLTVNPGTYWLRIDGGALGYYSCNGAFPYVDDSGQGLLSISATRHDGGNGTTFGTAFNWKITRGTLYPCDRVQVEVTEYCPPCMQPNSITLNPSTTTDICEGSNQTISATIDVSGLTPTDEWYYTWFKNGAAIGSASTTYSDLTITSAALSDGATYKLRVEDGTTGSSTCYKEASVVINVQSIIIPGVVAADQTICEGSAPNALTNTTSASGGNGTTYSYQWQSSTDNASYSNIGSATSATYAPGALTQTTWFRREVTSGVCAATVTTSVQITVVQTLLPGSIGSDESICANTSPTALTNASSPSGGNGTYSYSWEQSTDGTTWSVIGGAASATYAPGNLSQTTLFRRNVSSGPCGPVTSNVITITVLPGLSPGGIQTNQSICYNSTPAALTSTSLPSGGTGVYVYSWEYSTDGGAVWNLIGGEVGTGYTPISALTTTTQYRRVVTSGSGTCNTAYTTPVTVTVYGDLLSGSIAADQAICSGETPVAFTSASSPTGGPGLYVYSWELSTDGGTIWSVVGGATSDVYSPGTLTQTTSYRRRVASGTCTPVYTSPVVVTVTPTLQPGTIGSDDVICTGTAPSPLTDQVSPTGGDGSYNFTWESSIDNGVTWSPIGGANLATYAPGTLTQTTQFRRNVESGACGPLSSNVVTISVISSVTPTVSINGANPLNICAGDNASFTTNTFGGGPTPTYKWYLDGSEVIGALTSSYSNSALSVGTHSIYVDMTSSLGAGCATPLTVSSTPVTINVLSIPNPSINEPDTTVCSGSILTLSATAGSGTLNWLINGVSAGSGNPFLVPTSTAGIYSLTVNEDNGTCDVTSSPVVVTVVHTPIAFAGPDQYIKEGETITLSASGGSFYTWSPSTGLSDPNIANPTVTPIDPVTYTVTVSNGGTCTSSDDVRIFVERPVLIPNIFSPNGDDIHDVLKIKNLEVYPDAVLYVYNQWGELIFESDPGYPEPWDGKRNGKPVPVSTYYYVLKLHMPNVEDVSGSITIVK